MKLLDMIFMILEDGEWHTIKEILSATNENPLKLLLAINFLEHYHFIQVDRLHGTVKLWIAVKNCLDELKKLDEQ